MPYLLHLYVEVEDSDDEKIFTELLDDHDYPYHLGDTTGLPATIEHLEGMMRLNEETPLEEEEEK